ncbi:glycosyltransferase [Frigidibacter albus]|uniref:Glycosyltransferase n=1 Tax=Frigidibacter albus TaxID=1465486 RepID=A0A6L8VFZ0_9RHOB|nr:TIGR04283 family arsenosugar biosynthesis glycosyltransferase [Frigidibacter albus]MZQ89235.1 glycosyltransferase [Frigidibacter albus]NBE31141.1 glycosyltransferase [Frigidibacter albus]GGH53095.1 glycosyl transferase [Frigidibacter albus]
MRAPISIVIPTLNAAAELGPCLAALTEGLQAGLIRELIVSDGGSGDGTLALAEAAGALVVSGAPGRGTQVARGVAAAGGAWLLILHADTRLAPGWSGAVAAHIAGPERAGWFRLRFRGGGAAGRIVAGWANLRSRLGLPYGDQGLLVPAALLARVGGYPALPLMEDVAVARRLRGQMAPLASVAETSAARYLAEGWLRRGARNLWLLARYLAGADPARLAREYRRRR